MNANFGYEEKHYCSLEWFLPSVSWIKFQNMLQSLISLETYCQSTTIIKEIMNLENYLNIEYKVNEKEKFFSNQKHIVEYLNYTLKVLSNKNLYVFQSLSTINIFLMNRANC